MSKEKLRKATHQGTLKIGDSIIDCAVLEDDTRVITQTTFLRALGRSIRPPAGRGVTFEKVPFFLSANNLNPFISKELVDSTKTIVFKPLKGGYKGKSFGYNAQILPQVCYVYIDAEKEGVLLATQKNMLKSAEILIRGFAHVGIIALIDEATGYQDVRVQKALEKVLNEFLLKEEKPYIGTFPLEFYKQIYKLNNWTWVPENAQKRPGVIGTWTNDVIYSRIAPRLLTELQKRNPTIKPGRRKHKHFQFFTDKVGDPALMSHFDGVLALMRATPNWRKFKELLNRSYPKYGDTIPMDFGIDE